jgi:hypothetical protein
MTRDVETESQTILLLWSDTRFRSLFTLPPSNIQVIHSFGLIAEGIRNRIIIL